MNYLHGVETIEIEKGTRSIRTVKTAVIGLVGTAPIQNVDNEYKTVNKPILITNEKDAVKYFGESEAGYTIPSALNAIFDQGAGIVIVINIFDPDKHSAVSDIQLSDIIGTTNAQGKRTGLKAFKDCYSLFGFFPKTLIAPKYCEDTAVVTEMNVIASSIRAIGFVDAPVGTSVQEAISGRGPNATINFNTTSDRIILCYPQLKVYDTATNSEKIEPYSQRIAGVLANKDIEKGYWWSPSNTEIKGIIGAERQLTSMINDPQSKVNLLNSVGIMTVFNSFGSGLRTWGNRNASFPSSIHPKNFINIRRTADILHESVEYSMLQFYRLSD